MVVRLLGKIRVGEESKHTQTVIETNHHHSLFCQVLTVLARFGSRAGGKTSAIDPHHDRQMRLRRCRWRPYVQVQTVFAGPAVAENHVRENPALHAARPKVSRPAGAGPTRNRLGRFPAQSTDGRRREGNAFEIVDLRIGAHDALNRTRIGSEDFRTRSSKARRHHRGAAHGIALNGLYLSRHEPVCLYEITRNADGRVRRFQTLCHYAYRQETRRQEEKNSVEVTFHNTTLMSTGTMTSLLFRAYLTRDASARQASVRGVFVASGPCTSTRRLIPNAWHLTHSVADIFSGSVPFYKLTEVSRQLPQVPSGNRRPQRTGVCANRPTRQVRATFGGGFPVRPGNQNLHRRNIQTRLQSPQLG